MFAPQKLKKLAAMAGVGALVGLGGTLLNKSMSLSPQANQMLLLFPYFSADPSALDGVLRLYEFACFNGQDHKHFVITLAMSIHDVLKFSSQIETHAPGALSVWETFALIEKSQSLLLCVSNFQWTPFSIHDQIQTVVKELEETLQNIQFNMRQEHSLRFSKIRQTC